MLLINTTTRRLERPENENYLPRMLSYLTPGGTLR